MKQNIFSDFLETFRSLDISKKWIEERPELITTSLNLAIKYDRMIAEIIEELENNLWEIRAEDRIFYLQNVIRRFNTATASGLNKNIELWNEFCFQDASLKNKSDFEYYVFLCFNIKIMFLMHLEILCATFGLDHIDIQNKVGIHLKPTRSPENLIYYGFYHLFQEKEFIDSDGTVLKSFYYKNNLDEKGGRQELRFLPDGTSRFINYDLESKDPDYLLPRKKLQKIHWAFDGELWNEFELNKFYCVFNLNDENSHEIVIKDKSGFYALLHFMWEVSGHAGAKKKTLKPLLERNGLKYGTFTNIFKTFIEPNTKKNRLLLDKIKETMKIIE